MYHKASLTRGYCNSEGDIKLIPIHSICSCNFQNIISRCNWTLLLLRYVTNVNIYVCGPCIHTVWPLYQPKRLVRYAWVPIPIQNIIIYEAFELNS
jgi:hypothetical protein